MGGSVPVWFITAASSGFRRSLALEALSRGHKVIASARSLSRIASLKDAGADTVVLDVTSPLDELLRVAREANEKYGAVEETSPEEDLKAFTTNVLGTLNVAKAFLPHLRATLGHRTISNFGSVASWYSGAGHGIYSGTKWAVSGVTEGLHAELAPLGIFITVVEPGWYCTATLSKDVQAQSEKRIDAYVDGKIGELRKALAETDGKKIPIRLVLGKDAHDIIREKCEVTLKLLKEWEGAATNTDHN